jgi:hypothetical protein
LPKSVDNVVWNVRCEGLLLDKVNEREKLGEADAGHVLAGSSPLRFLAFGLEVFVDKSSSSVSDTTIFIRNASADLLDVLFVKQIQPGRDENNKPVRVRTEGEVRAHAVVT